MTRKWTCLFCISLAAVSLSHALSIDSVTDEGQMSYKITTNSATYYYHKEGGGFSSMVDNQGNDWIGYSTATGSSGEYRGIPNLVHRTGGTPGFFHPGYTGSKGSSTKIESRSAEKIAISSTSQDGNWKVQWEFYETYARLVVQASNSSDPKYWFLYEGTPGGSFQTDRDYWLISNGTRNACATTKNGDIPGPEWICFGDNNLKRVLFLVHNNDDTKEDRYYQMESNMTVFGFGRTSDYLNKLLSAVPDTFTIGFAEDSSYTCVKDHINAILAGGPGNPVSRDDVEKAIQGKKQGSATTSGVQTTIDNYVNERKKK